ncbi:hypothetical protein DEO72_LG3g1262 [Vigna unguiculata]|uniref:Uncharacterized protein n=1 Tax=Vigna unguiculata TaxID=3917 RepID=A0A4D6LE98_VIGUN|nr:hypothetical protein DEO72_LG3g1262 [Vigna unguiculata]
MASRGSGYNSDILWTFNTIHIANLSVAYIDRHFAVAFEDELLDDWELVDSKGQIHFVTYNKDVDHPKITHGWMDIRRDFHISGDCDVQFSYTGNSRFQITVFAGTCSQLSMQRYLRHAATEFNDTIICVRLTQYQSRGSHLEQAYQWKRIAEVWRVVWVVGGGGFRENWWVAFDSLVGRSLVG